MKYGRVFLKTAILLSFLSRGFAWTPSNIGSARAGKVSEMDDGSRLLIGNWYVGIHERVTSGEWTHLGQYMPEELRRHVRYANYLNQSTGTIHALADIMAEVLSDPDSIHWISRDHGRSWETIPQITEQYNNDIFLASTTNPDEWFVFSRRILSHTMDAGVTWESTVMDTLHWQKMGAFEDPINPNKLAYYGFYAYMQANGEYGGLVVSNDHGESWDNWHPLIHFNEDLGTSDGIILAGLRMSNGNYLVAFLNLDQTQTENWISNTLVMVDSTGTVLGRYGSELPDRNTPTQLFEVSGQPGRLFTLSGELYGVFRSDDYGETWQLQYGNGLPDFRFGADRISQNPTTQTLYLSTTSEGVYKSNDLGDSWERVDTPYNARFANLQFSQERTWVLPAESNAIYIIASDTDVFTRYDYPFSPNEGASISDLYVEGDSLFTCVYHWQQTSPNGETNKWTTIDAYSFASGTWESFGETDSPTGYMHASLTSQGIRWERFIEYGSVLQTSWDHGRTWQSVNSPVTLFASNPPITTDSTSIFLGEELLKYNYATNEWTDLHMPDHPGLWINSKLIEAGGILFLHQCTPQRFYSYESDQWTERSHPDAPSAYSIAAYDGDNGILLFMAENHGYKLFISSDTARTWQISPVTLPGADQANAFEQVHVDPYRNRLWIMTGAGMYWGDLDWFVGVSDGEQHEFQPAEFALLDAYPNPSNARVRFNIEIARSGNVQLKLFNLLGQVVYKWVGGYHEKGHLNATWDGTEAASGTYIATLEVNGKPLVNRRVTLIK